ncbi:MAG: hypothetical protein WB792_01815 [Desulfobacterales bacterium]
MNDSVFQCHGTIPFLGFVADRPVGLYLRLSILNQWLTVNHFCGESYPCIGAFNRMAFASRTKRIQRFVHEFRYSDLSGI